MIWNRERRVSLFKFCSDKVLFDFASGFAFGFTEDRSHPSGRRKLSSACQLNMLST